MHDARFRFYPISFASPPNREGIHPDAFSPEFFVSRQEQDHFRVEKTDKYVSRTYH
jgi:hypothetical protein